MSGRRSQLGTARRIMYAVAGMVAVLAIKPAYGQYESAIRGIVTEQTGAVVPNVWSD